MNRTTIMLPHALKVQVMRQARKKGISMGQFIRDAIAAAITRQDELESQGADPLLTDDEVFSGSVPEDLSIHHDKFLYEKD